MTVGEKSAESVHASRSSHSDILFFVLWWRTFKIWSLHAALPVSCPCPMTQHTFMPPHDAPATWNQFRELQKCSVAFPKKREKKRREVGIKFYRQTKGLPPAAACAVWGSTQGRECCQLWRRTDVCTESQICEPSSRTRCFQQLKLTLLRSSWLCWNTPFIPLPAWHDDLRTGRRVVEMCSRRKVCFNEFHGCL